VASGGTRAAGREGDDRLSLNRFARADGTSSSPHSTNVERDRLHRGSEGCKVVAKYRFAKNEYGRLPEMETLTRGRPWSCRCGITARSGGRRRLT
jgi:hypothetical protein